MALTYGGTFRNQIIDGITGINPSPRYLKQSNVVLEIWSGSAPSVSTASTGTKLSPSIALSTVGWNAASAGIAALSGAINFTGAATATAGYFRVIDNNGTSYGDATTKVLFQGTVGVSSSGADLIMSSTSVVSGNTATISNFSIKQALSNGSIKLSDTLANDIVDMIVGGTSIDFGTATEFRFYSGSAPSNANTIPTGTLLLQAYPQLGSWSAASGNAAALVANTMSSGNETVGMATGTAGYCRIVDGASTSRVIQCSVGTSGTDVITTSTSVVAAIGHPITAATLGY